MSYLPPTNLKMAALPDLPAPSRQKGRIGQIFMRYVIISVLGHDSRIDTSYELCFDLACHLHWGIN
jgi:hypothetical protein